MSDISLSLLHLGYTSCRVLYMHFPVCLLMHYYTINWRLIYTILVLVWLFRSGDVCFIVLQILDRFSFMLACYMLISDRSLPPSPLRINMNRKFWKFPPLWGIQRTQPIAGFCSSFHMAGSPFQTLNCRRSVIYADIFIDFMFGIYPYCYMH